MSKARRERTAVALDMIERLLRYARKVKLLLFLKAHTLEIEPKDTHRWLNGLDDVFADCGDGRERFGEPGKDYADSFGDVDGDDYDEARFRVEKLAFRILKRLFRLF